MTLKDIAKQLTTAVQTVPNLIQILHDGFEQVEAGSSTIEYSTTERLIGKWIDGKPLYQKSINIGAVVANNVKNIDITDLHVDYVADYIATAVLTNGWKIPIPLTHTSSFANQAFCRLNSSTELAVGVGSTAGISDGYVTLQYTKTTD